MSEQQNNAREAMPEFSKETKQKLCQNITPGWHGCLPMLPVFIGAKNGTDDFFSSFLNFLWHFHNAVEL